MPELNHSGMASFYSLSRNIRDVDREIRAQSEIRLHREYSAQFQPSVRLFFKITSWLPPSTIDVEETTVSLAFCCSSGIESAPQLHIVERTL